MIASFFEAMFAYADDLKAQGKTAEYETVHHVEDLLQQAYDSGIQRSSVIKGRKGSGTMEKLVLSIPDILVYKDPTDGQIWYELECDEREMERKRFDYPEEVLRHVIDYRTHEISKNMGYERELFLRYVSQRIRDLRMKQEVLERGGKCVTTKKRRK